MNMNSSVRFASIPLKNHKNSPERAHKHTVDLLVRKYNIFGKVLKYIKLKSISNSKRNHNFPLWAKKFSGKLGPRNHKAILYCKWVDCFWFVFGFWNGCDEWKKLRMINNAQTSSPATTTRVRVIKYWMQGITVAYGRWIYDEAKWLSHMKRRTRN